MQITLTENHISSLITILSTTITMIYVWSLFNPELAARVVERFISAFNNLLKAIDKISDMIDKWKE